MRAFTLDNLTNVKLRQIEWQVSGSLWSIRLTMSDGR
jgi:hypothetical protein